MNEDLIPSGKTNMSKLDHTVQVLLDGRPEKRFPRQVTFEKDLEDKEVSARQKRRKKKSIILQEGKQEGTELQHC